MTPLQDHGGIWVKREDLFDPDLPSGKLRGLIPYLTGLRLAGVKRVVNVGATHSNSHAIVAYAGRKVGLDVLTVVNSDQPHPATDHAAALGAEVVYTQPGHLAPLRAAGRRIAEERDAAILPWGLAGSPIIRRYADAMHEVDEQLETDQLVHHVVPMGAGGVVTGLWMGGWKRHAVVLAVPVMPTTQRNDERRVTDLTMTIGLPGGLRIVLPPGPGAETPFPSDPAYEHVAWPVATDLHAQGRLVVFWNVGQALH